MPIYSHSQLSTYEDCPLKYKLSYRDRIKREVEGIEGFLGSMVHETLKKCYDDVKLTKLDTLEELLTCYDHLWQQNWHDGIVITKQDLTREHYYSKGKKLIEGYYRRYAPFDAEITINNEMRLNFALDRENKYRMTGYIDRLSCKDDGSYQIHDYKTSNHLPSQEEADNDRQLGLYQIGIQQRWPDIQNIKLIWHYLAFDRELVSSRSDEAINRLVTQTIGLIEEIESTQSFMPKESPFCEWCEYPDLCPLRKHFFKVAALPINEYLNEPGVALANKYAELKDKATALDAEIEKVREAILDYARREQAEVLKGSDRKIKVRFDNKLKFPGKNESGRQELDKLIKDGGKWLEVSQLDATALAKIIGKGVWNKELIVRVLGYSRVEEVSSIHVSKLTETEE